MRKVKPILSVIFAAFILTMVGCSQSGCPTAKSAGKGKPSGGGGSSQKLFNKDMRR